MVDHSEPIRIFECPRRECSDSQPLQRPCPRHFVSQWTARGDDAGAILVRGDWRYWQLSYSAGTAAGAYCCQDCRSVDGIHTINAGGKSIDNPAHSTVVGTQQVLWASNSGANQKWKFVQQADGSYPLQNVESGFCADVADGSYAAGARIIQWTCTGGTNQRWAMPQSRSTFAFTSVKIGLLLTSTGSADGTGLTQQAPSSSWIQSWTIQ